jgi:hypothetical protein
MHNAERERFFKAVKASRSSYRADFADFKKHSAGADASIQPIGRYQSISQR